MSELKELIQVGRAVRVYYNEGNVNNHVVHIRAVVDDEYVVYRVWLKSQKWWRYKVDHISWFEVLHKRGFLLDADAPAQGREGA